ncbi:hypothetical protein [Streptacidiphilus neutrinimicus]|uniref:hypothetical protein n=1 Tax=Streptacidiphilus neutrinimicus TaxID=105420 RepID=UPI0005AB197D|nr:hypothetical protein [Streptacidiphilus neutrinimicus]
MRASRAQNQAKHWEDRQAAATTPQQQAAVWYDACRMLAANLEAAGKPEVWTRLAEQLRGFYQDYSG